MSSNLTVDRHMDQFNVRNMIVYSDVVHNSCTSAASSYVKHQPRGPKSCIVACGAFCSKNILKFILIVHIYYLKNAKFT